MTDPRKPWLVSYPAGVPAEIDAHRYANLNELFDDAVRRFGPRVAFINMLGRITYTELDREQIVNAFRSAGFSLRREEEGTLFFRADGFVQKLLLLWEDEIRVSQYGQWIELDGIRRGVARVQYRLDSYLQMKRRNEK